MKVTVLGGTGVFGHRLCRLLARDGHAVTIAGRTLAKAKEAAAVFDGQALQVDREGDLGPLAGAEVIIDAAGPFHSYGTDPYRLARWAIGQGISYLDLADDAEFCAGIANLDAAAKAAGVFALSGVSSVPAVSSAAVQALAQDLAQIEVIETAILPGNRAPRGQSVVDSILHQTGASVPGWEGGVRAPFRGWSRSKVYDLGQGIRRRAYMIGVPDQRLFGAFFKVRTVWFRAGLELGVMNRGLAVLSVLRRVTGLALPAGGRRGLLWLAKRLEPFGTDRGGMEVSVAGPKDGRILRRRWVLRVGAGDGPFIPGVAARAILRRPDRIPPGARPALAEVPLQDLESAMQDLDVQTARTEVGETPVFPAVLGASFETLPERVRHSHLHAGPTRFEGRGSVVRGRGRLARAIGTLFGFPPASDSISVTVTKTPFPGGEVWLRDFGGRQFRSVLTQGPTGLRERFGPLSFDLGLVATDKGLAFPVAGGRCCGLPLPLWALPRSESMEASAEGRFTFDVRLSLPLGLGEMVHYRGWLVKTGAQ